MKKILLALSIIFLLCSCNMNLLNGDVEDFITTPEKGNSVTFTGAKVENLKGSQSSSTDQIVLSWNAVAGADYYVVQRAEVTKVGDTVLDTAWQDLTVKSLTNSYVDKFNLDKTKFYAYRVKAAAFTEIVGEWSDITYSYLLTQPSVFTASNGEETYVRLNWSKVEGATGYLIKYTYEEKDNYLEGWNTFSSSSSTYFPSNATSVLFKPLDGKGGLVRFVIYAIGQAKVISAPSIIVSGSIRVPGAPDKVTNVVIGQGESLDRITISWDAPVTECSWKIIRSSEGTTPIEVTETNKPTKEDKRYSFVDKDVKAGISYTYQIMGVGTVTNSEGETSVVTGAPVSKTGYLLSPPTVVKEVNFNNSNTGFTFTFSPAVGATTHPDWEYNIYAKKAFTDSYSLYKTIPVETSDITIDTNFLSDGYQYFDIKTSNGTIESELYKKITSQDSIFVPVPSFENYKATENVYQSGMSDINGFYPISISMDKNPMLNNNFELTITDSATKEVVRTYTDFTFDSDDTKLYVNNIITSTKIGVKYNFRLVYTDILGRKSPNLTTSGYSAITDKLFKEVWESVSFKPWQKQDYVPEARKAYWTRTSDGIWSYVKWGYSSSLTDQMNALTGGNVITDTDNSTRSGKVTYKAVQEGMGGAIYFTYTNFGDGEYMYTSGNYEMHVNASGNGSPTLNNGFDVYGYYPGKITFENITVQSKDFAGQYTVKQDGREASKVGV